MYAAGIVILGGSVVYCVYRAGKKIIKMLG